MITKNDINALKKVLATKNDIKKLEDVSATKEEFKTTQKSLEDKIISFKDAILKEIKDMRDDIAIIVGYRDTIEEHEERIEKIERHIRIPQPQ